jgi:PBSX family phage terminase large subunit
MKASEPTKIEFNPKLFNPVFWHITETFSDTDVRFFWLYGGSSASKSYSIAQAVVKDMLSNGDNMLVLRKESTSIDDSIYADFKKIITDWGILDEFQFVKHQIRCKNGSYVKFKGLDSPDKLKGVSQYKRVWMEEADQFDSGDLKQIRKRLRGMIGQQIIIVFNPVDENHWLKLDYYDKESLTNISTDLGKWIKDAYGITQGLGDNQTITTLDKNSYKKVNATGDTVIIKTTYLDNFYICGHPDGVNGFVDHHVLNDFERDRRDDYNFYIIYALGLWGKINVGGEFYKKFSHPRDTAPTMYDCNTPLHISFDENVHPHMTLCIWQGQGKKAYQIDEICLEDPRNTLPETLNEFKSRYPAKKHMSKLFIYGDRTSLKQDAKLEKGQNFYRMALEQLKDYDPTLRLPKKNPPVAMRGLFINEVFSSGFDGCMIIIGDHCNKTISDYKYLKEAPDGTKHKKKIKNPDTGVSYEQWGHCTDANDYFICEYFKESFILYQGRDNKSRYYTGIKKLNTY